MGNFSDRMDSYCNDWISTVCKETAGLTTPLVKDTSIVQDTVQKPTVFYLNILKCNLFL